METETIVVKRYEVSFVNKQGYCRKKDEVPVVSLQLTVWASSINEAIAEAWKTVTLSPNDYEIDRAVETNLRRYSYAWDMGPN